MTPMHKLCDGSLECDCHKRRASARITTKQRAHKAEYMRNYMREYRRKKKETSSE